MKPQEYLDLKADYEEAVRQATLAEGAYKETMDAIKKQFKCKSLGDALKLLRKMEKENNKLLEQYQDHMETYKVEWDAWWEEVYAKS